MNQLNQRDNLELKKRLKDLPQNREFRELFFEYTGLCAEIMWLQTSNNAPIAARTPSAREIQDGKPPVILVAVNPGSSQQEIVKQLMALRLEIEAIAVRLSRKFPLKRRGYWQEIFISMAFGGDGNVQQAQRGGRRNDELYELAAQWQKEDFKPESKKAIIATYLEKHSDGTAHERVLQYLKRYQSKHLNKTKTRKRNADQAL